LILVKINTGVLPKANIPRVEFPVAEPVYELALAAAPVPLVSQAYVYLLRVVTTEPVHPRANIPLVLFPVAAPRPELLLAAVAETFVSPE
jgi:hypothetical protein